jgi:NAD(P)-dependent dehydrogenase (short-subunit alcohol dehydrogenase family)
MPLNKISEKVSGMGGLQIRIAMVTGAGAGMGREHALLLAERGATVVVQDIDGEGARETAERISRAGGLAHIVACDVADGPHWQVAYRVWRTALAR